MLEEGTTNSIRYAGEFYDLESGLYYLRARYYNPEIGRFISEDSYWGEDTNPLSLNLYTYCFNNPIKYIDPTGHIVSEWDRDNLSVKDQGKIKIYTARHNYAEAIGDEVGMAAAHAGAEAVRDAVRTEDEIGSSDGYTYVKKPSKKKSSSSNSSSNDDSDDVNIYTIYEGDQGKVSSNGYTPKDMIITIDQDCNDTGSEQNGLDPELFLIKVNSNKLFTEQEFVMIAYAGLGIEYQYLSAKRPMNTSYDEYWETIALTEDPNWFQDRNKLKKAIEHLEHELIIKGSVDLNTVSNDKLNVIRYLMLDYYNTESWDEKGLSTLENIRHAYDIEPEQGKANHLDLKTLDAIVDRFKNEDSDGLNMKGHNSLGAGQFNKVVDQGLLTFVAFVNATSTPNNSQPYDKDVRDAEVGQGNRSMTKGTVQTADDIPWGSWSDYEKVTMNGQEYAKVGDRLYSHHAVDRMQPSGFRYPSGQAITQAGGSYGRSVAPQYVEDVINSVEPILQENGNLKYIGGTLEVVTNQEGAVVTIMTK